MDLPEKMNALRKCHEAYDEARENVIALSRSIVRKSKKVITAVHDDRLQEALTHLGELKQLITQLQEEKSFLNTGSYSMAMQEYVEAMLFYHYVVEQQVLGYDQFSCSPEEYLLGICDFIGELQRRAVVLISKGDKETIKQIYAVAKALYDGLLDMSFRGELRKKFDAVKYMIIRLEDIQMNLTLR